MEGSGGSAGSGAPTSIPPPSGGPPPGSGGGGSGGLTSGDHHLHMDASSTMESTVDKLVEELKSQGMFDQIRKDCLAEVDTKVQSSTKRVGTWKICQCHNCLKFCLLLIFGKAEVLY